MAFNIFKKKNNNSIKEFLQQLKDGERDIIKAMGSSSGDFGEASFEQIMSNEDDVLAGVNRVQTSFNKVYFGMFDACLIKHFDSGDVEHLFYTNTRDADAIIEMADAFFDKLGTGIFDDSQFSSFRDTSKIRALARGDYHLYSDAPMHNWFHDDLSLGLYYRISPLRQFTMHVTIKAPRIPDNAIRRKGTILELLRFDPYELMREEPVHVTEEFSGDEIKFIDYTFMLREKEWDLFNVAELKVFSSKKAFDKFTQTHLKLYAVGPVDPDKKIAAVESLCRLYGEDVGGSGELQFCERDKLENGTFWIGRTWRFNEAHAPLDLDAKDQKFSYEVRVDNMEDTESFQLNILCYHNLVALFGLNV